MQSRPVERTQHGSGNAGIIHCSSPHTIAERLATRLVIAEEFLCQSITYYYNSVIIVLASSQPGIKEIMVSLAASRSGNLALPMIGLTGKVDVAVARLPRTR